MPYFLKISEVAEFFQYREIHKADSLEDMEAGRSELVEELDAIPTGKQCYSGDEEITECDEAGEEPSMTNLPQGPGSFIAAMECVKEGGKAWRADWVTTNGQVCIYMGAAYDPCKVEDLDTVCFGHYPVDPELKDYPYEIEKRDLEATDWVCEPMEGG